MAATITFWGTRGSVPSPGLGTVRYGGNTACLTVESDRGERLILDAGTGIRRLGQHLITLGPDSPSDMTLLLSHTHWDHIQGLPFFRPLYQRGNTLTILGPRPEGAGLEAVIRGQLAPAVFPVPPDAMGARMTVTEIQESEFGVPGFSVRATRLCHSAPTLGFSIRSAAGGRRVSYFTDNELGGAAGEIRWPQFVRFLQDTDTLIHDTTYFESQLEERRGWGHSSATEALTLAAEAGCRRLVLFHHDPDHDDQAVERLRDEARRNRPVEAARVEILIAAEGESLRC